MQRLVITDINDIRISAVCEDMTMKTVRVLQEDSVLGNIYVGRVENVVNNIQAAFVEYEKGRKGYYSLAENNSHIFLDHKENSRLCQGDRILVQISKDGVKTKDPVLTSRIGLTGRYCALSINNKTDYVSVFASKKIADEKRKTYLQNIVREAVKEELAEIDERTSDDAGRAPVFDVIVRTNAENASDDVVTKEAVSLVRKFRDIFRYAPSRKAFTRMHAATDTVLEDVQNMRDSGLEKIITDIPEIYDALRDYLAENEPEGLTKLEAYDDKMLPLAKLYNLEAQLKNALKTRVWLPSGGYLVIEPTEALTVIDVNTGKFTGNRRLTTSTYLKINKEAAEEIGRQLMLRNLSGIIIADFINLETAQEKRELMSYLDGILSKDVVPASLIDMTKLGLVEITRKKIRKPLHEIMGKDISLKADG